VWLVHMHHTAHGVYRNLLGYGYVALRIHICGVWLIHMCHMTHRAYLHLLRQKCVALLIYMCDMCVAVCCSVLQCVAVCLHEQFIYMRDM